MKKRLLSMLLCVAMCLSVMHVPAYAEESTENEPEKTIAEETTSFVDEALEEDFQQIMKLLLNLKILLFLKLMI